MIRDPSDGSVKRPDGALDRHERRPAPPKRGTDPDSVPPCSANNWGLKSLDREARAPKPAPTAEELRQHYEKFKLGFELKEQNDANGR